MRIQIAGEDGSFIATGARADFHDDIAPFQRVGRKDGHLDGGLKVGQLLLQGGDFRLGHLGELVAALGHLTVVGQFSEPLLVGVPVLDELLQGAVLAHELAGFLRVVEEAGRGHEAFQFFQTLALFVDEGAVVHEGAGSGGTKQKRCRAVRGANTVFEKEDWKS